MNLPLYQVDAFTDTTFRGNPAAVCPLREWPEDQILQNIALENNLSETAFFVDQGDYFHLRWFTPTLEIDLCGHATLASAFVIFQYLGYDKNTIRFRTKGGELSAVKQDDKIALNFPAWKPQPITLPPLLPEALSLTPIQTLKTRDLIALFPSEEQILSLHPNFALLEQLEPFCVIATAPGKNCDFVSRVFAPKAGVPEDPVTGSAHSSLIPYWAEKLQKNELVAFQLSKRSGVLFCRNLGERVLIAGHCAPYLKGTITI